MIASLLLWSLFLMPLAGVPACLFCGTPRAVMRVVPRGVMAWSVAAAACAWSVRGGEVLSTAGNWLRLDALSGFHLFVMMLVFLLSSLYVPGYFRDEIREHVLSLRHARRFGALWFGALAAMTLVLLSNNVGIMWVSIEATTLVTAFLICIHRTPASLEAMWKYLIICSVGVAFAFMGTLLTSAAAEASEAASAQSLLWTDLRENAARLNPTLIKLAFVFLLVGYGTKAGLAPMHSWLPDAHSQAPAPVSALFSGFMLNAALYCVMRYIPIVEICTGHVGWSPRLLLFFGLVSIMTAAAFIIFQHDLKRLLAYHSVEHLGIISVGLGLGGLGIFAALLHTLNHSLCKALSFYAAGRLGQMYGTNDMSKMGGALRAAPVWGKALLGSLLVLIGVAPFAIFYSEFLILRAAAQSGSYWTLGLFLLGAAIVFVGALQHAIAIAWGAPAATPKPEQAGGVDKVIVVFSLAALFALGIWIPGFLREIIEAAKVVVEGVF